MYKKLIGWILFVVVVLVLGIVASLWLRIESKPVEIPAIESVQHDAAPSLSSEKAELWLRDLYGRTQLPSVSVAVGVGGKLVWSAAIGHSDLKTGELADSQSLYRIGSVSKPLTAAALMRLVEHNSIDLDASFSDYVEDFNPSHGAITLRDLASHQGGVRHYPDGLGFFKENFSNKEYPTSREAAAVTENDPLLFEPGEGFQYSTHGYTLLSLAMERAYGHPFEDLMTQQVFAPLGMASTVFDKKSEVRPDAQTTPYLLVENRLIRAPQVNLSYKYAAGGYLSTPSDLVRYGNALLNDSFISESSKSTLWTPRVMDNGEMNYENYALGFRAGDDNLGRYVHHGGKSVGGYAHFVIYPDQQVVVAILTNVTPMGFIFDRQQESRKLAKIFSADPQ